MNIIFKAISICLITVVLWVTLSSYNKNAAILLSLCACCGILIPAYEYLSPVMQYFEELQQNSGWDNSAMQTVIRAAGIGILSELAALICTDAGNSSIAKAIRILSSACIMWLSLPMFRTLMELVESIVGEL
jgi:stage III sporulation protein AD